MSRNGMSVPIDSCKGGSHRKLIISFQEVDDDQLVGVETQPKKKYSRI